MDNAIKTVWDNSLGMKFQNEPVWRWAFFVIILGLMLNVWRGVLDHMK